MTLARSPDYRSMLYGPQKEATAQKHMLLSLSCAVGAVGREVDIEKHA